MMKRRSRSNSRSRLATMSDDENLEPEQSSIEANDTTNQSINNYTPSVGLSMPKSILRKSMIRSPLTPMHNLVISMRQRLEAQLGASGTAVYTDSEDKTSPGLAQLRNTPKGSLRQRQAQLAEKHKAAQDRIDCLNVGGGISIWPQMANMRLTCRETCLLAITSSLLIFLTALLFTLIHGDVEERLRQHHQKLLEFPAINELITNKSNMSFKHSVLAWHSAFTHSMADIHGAFTMSLAQARPAYQIGVLLYIFGILTLLYYLADNIVAHSKLTPRRIKIWVSLLAIMGTWTLKVLHLLMLAHRLEYAVETVIHSLSDKLGMLVHLELELKTYHDVLLHWRTCCLPPTTMGTLTVMGVVSIRDIMYYLQYYSLPVGTALLTPVIKLIWSLLEVYGFQST